ncbi:DUF6934 family protein [Flavobacterium aquidurense]|uniref:Uncharacterized protein n=1 Tax=Flavobacterium aquidurense TaxID=362413 RepID=A0A0Q1B9M6_9FLAO|nr:hypothetical protein [Flavobacterium aquidurense]KQB37041.1 hypothetical protein RC62_2207 [Flavobacterium aquidurense]
MDYPKYDLKVSSNSTIFEFISSGKQGNINKVIKYTLMQNPEIVNLGFGDKININESKGTFDIDDVNTTNNGDRNIILATVANATYIYTEIYPDKFIFFSGSCKIRTRLYRILISSNYNELVKTFFIFGILQNPITGKYYNVSFRNDTNFIGFLIKRK